MELPTEQPKQTGTPSNRGGEITQRHLERMGIPKRHWYCTLEKIPSECPHKARILDWIEHVEHRVKDSQGLLLMGDYSMGKTGLASICLKAACQRGIIGYWITARAYPQQVIQQHAFDQKYSVQDRAETVPLLVIDELQVREGNVKFSEQAIEHLVRTRIDANLCTIITTNHNTEFLKDHYQALTEALREAVTPIVVTGHNFREDRQKEFTDGRRPGPETA